MIVQFLLEGHSVHLMKDTEGNGFGDGWGHGYGNGSGRGGGNGDGRGYGNGWGVNTWNNKNGDGCGPILTGVSCGEGMTWGTMRDKVDTPSIYVVDE